MRVNRVKRTEKTKIRRQSRSKLKINNPKIKCKIRLNNPPKLRNKYNLSI